jgi:hypothetical protein
MGHPNNSVVPYGTSFFLGHVSQHSRAGLGIVSSCGLEEQDPTRQKMAELGTLAEDPTLSRTTRKDGHPASRVFDSLDAGLKASSTQNVQLWSAPHTTKYRPGISPCPCASVVTGLSRRGPAKATPEWEQFGPTWGL